MTIDERLESVTHSVELLAQMQIKTEKDLKPSGSISAQSVKWC
jgi:hypothetical protein